MNFQEYLQVRSITNRTIIKEILLNAPFRIVGNHSGHSYSHTDEERNLLRFNNPNMTVGRERLTSGVILRGRTIRDSIDYSELELVTGDRASILLRIKVITETKKKLQAEQDDLLTQLDYLRINKTNLVDYNAFKEFKVKRIVEGRENQIVVEV